MAKTDSKACPVPSRRNFAFWLTPLICGLLVATIVGVQFYSAQRKYGRYPDYAQLEYRLVETYQGTTFFDKFYNFNEYDPEIGFALYADRYASDDLNLTYASAKAAVLRVWDNDDNADAGYGRVSVRVQSKAQYNEGLFIFDIIHTPYGCGTWPNLYLLDPSNWPSNGQINVLESVNLGDSGSYTTLHTADGCTMKNIQRRQTGLVLATSCVNTTGENSGCGVLGPPETFGETFNQHGGGVFALSLTPLGIRQWFFPRNSTPPNVIPTSLNPTTGPDPSTWGTPVADFPGTTCDIASHFYNLTLALDIDLCGGWAGSKEVFGRTGWGGRCVDFVSSENGAFGEAFWEIGGIWVWGPV